MDFSFFVNQLIRDLHQYDTRERALVALADFARSQSFPNLGPVLWHSFGVVYVLLQEIISVYPVLSSATLLMGSTARVCNALALLEIIGLHPETKYFLLRAQIPEYLYPFLKHKRRERPLEYLRSGSLKVVGALVKDGHSEIISYFLEAEVIPLCLCAMEVGTESSRIVATFILYKLLMDDFGLQYACVKPERFAAISNSLWRMIVSPSEEPCSNLLLKSIIHCFNRFLDHPSTCRELAIFLPHMLKEPRFSGCLHDNSEIGEYLRLFIAKLFRLSAGNQELALQATGLHRSLPTGLSRHPMR